MPGCVLAYHLWGRCPLYRSFTTVWTSMCSRSEGGWSIQTLPEIGTGRSLTRFCDVFIRVQPTAKLCLTQRISSSRALYNPQKNPAFKVNCSGCIEIKQSRNVLVLFGRNLQPTLLDESFNEAASKFQPFDATALMLWIELLSFGPPILELIHQRKLNRREIIIINVTCYLWCLLFFLDLNTQTICTREWSGYRY